MKAGPKSSVDPPLLPWRAAVGGLVTNGQPNATPDCSKGDRGWGPPIPPPPYADKALRLGFCTGLGISGVNFQTPLTPPTWRNTLWP